MQVGQQLTADAADSYINLLCRLASVIVFSSDTPGGYDELPLNERFRDYWIGKFADRGFDFDSATTTKLQSTWREANMAPWIYENLAILRSQ
jgi:hypothetical protein